MVGPFRAPRNQNTPAQLAARKKFAIARRINGPRVPAGPQTADQLTAAFLQNERDKK